MIVTGPVTIGVTGALASGKSAFLHYLNELGAETLSADQTVHRLLAEDQETIDAVLDRFGEEVRGSKGVDRGLLAGKVFGDPKALRDLESILHPRVAREISSRIKSSRAALFAAEVPLLFEAGLEGLFDVVVAVVADEEKRMQWAHARGLSPEHMQAMESRQLSQEEKARRADVVIYNEGSLDELKSKARMLREDVLVHPEAKRMGGELK